MKKIVASDRRGNDYFGTSLALTADTLAVGSPGHDYGRGAAYVFQQHEGGADAWGEVRQITASDGEESDGFGRSVTLEGDLLVVGAFGTGGSTSGSVYLCYRDLDGSGAWGRDEQDSGCRRCLGRPVWLVCRAVRPQR